MSQVPEPVLKPDADHRFFVFCPYSKTFFYFKTPAERDLYTDQKVIDDFLDDGWHEGVLDIVAGELSHICVAVESDYALQALAP